MNKIERFEDIIAWQKARQLTQQFYGFARQGSFARDFGLRDQVQRASVSTTANIAEGFERGGDKEFIQFLSTAKGSCGEVKSHLYGHWIRTTSRLNSSKICMPKLTKSAG